MSQILPQTAIDWNLFFNLAGIIALVALSVVVGAMVYFTVKYRERRGQALYVPERWLERTRARDAVVFAVISIIILTSVTVAGERLTYNARFIPDQSQAFKVNVTAFQWSFKFQYPNGAISQGHLYLPADTTVLFNATSPDVMHNFFLVEYKVSIDAVPGRNNFIWIKTPQVPGNDTLNYQIICKELCGTGHASMRVPMTILNQESFNQWLSNQTTSNSTSTGGGG